MALDKKLMLPGVKLRVKSLKANTAGISFPFSTTELEAIRAWVSPGQDIAFAANVGEVLEVVKKPRRIYQTINCCRVRNAAGVEGDVYWTELRSNSEMATE